MGVNMLRNSAAAAALFVFSNKSLVLLNLKELLGSKK